MPQSNQRVTYRVRVPYARALYAAAIAALLSACSSPEVTSDVTPDHGATAQQTSGSAAEEMAVVVVTASRAERDSIS